MLLPKCLEIIGNDTKSAELRVSYDAPTNQTSYQYSIVWEDATNGAEEKYRVAINEANKIMLALKAKKLKKSNRNNREKNAGNNRKGKTFEEQVIEKQDPGLPFPPDLRSRSEQRENSEEPSNPISTSSSSQITTARSDSALSNKKNSSEKKKKSRSSSRSVLSKHCPLKLETVGCLDDQQNVTAKIVIIDSPNFRGKLKPLAWTKTAVSTKVKRVLLEVLRKNFDDIKPEKALRSAGILVVAGSDKKIRKLRRIDTHIDSISMGQLQTFRGSVVLILDLVGFVAKGKKVPLQLDIAEEQSS